MSDLRNGMLVTILPLKCSGIVKSVGRGRDYKIAVTYWSRSAGTERTDVFADTDLELVGGTFATRRRPANA